MARVPPLFLDYPNELNEEFQSPDPESKDQAAATTNPLSRYQIEKKLGESAYLVCDQCNNNEFKVLRRLDFDDSDEVNKKKVKLKLKRMQKEYFHHNIIRIYDVFEAESSIYIVTEYCEGGTLHGVISRAKKQDETLNEIEVMDWIVEILWALQHIHDMDLTHGNISVSNILLKNNSVKLNCTSEMKSILMSSTAHKEEEKYPGLAATGNLSLLDIEDDDELSTDTNLQHYTSPEEKLGNSTTNKSDIWTAGCLIYEMCHQKKLLQGSTPEDTDSSIPSIGIEAELPEYYPQQLNSLWKRMIDFDPKKRPSAFELLEDPFLLEHAQEMDLPVFTFREEPREPRLQNVFDQREEDRYVDSPDIEDESWLESLIAASPTPDPENND